MLDGGTLDEGVLDDVVGAAPVVVVVVVVVVVDVGVPDRVGAPEGVTGAVDGMLAGLPSPSADIAFQSSQLTTQSHRSPSA